MGNQKVKWTAEEEEALKAGVAKHGVGKWKIILRDSDFALLRVNRSNVDLKDKWRNMGVYHGHVCGGISSNTKGKSTSTSAVPPETQNTSAFISEDNANNTNPSQSPQDVKNAVNDVMIIEALSSIKDNRGADFGSIVGFIEENYEVPPKLKTLVSSKLKRLVLQGKLEKVRKRYKIKDASFCTKTPIPKQNDIGPRPSQKCRSLEHAAKMAAHMIAESENKSFIVAEAVKESERISKMAEEADAYLSHLKEVFGQWEDQGSNTSCKLSGIEVILMV